MSHTPGPWHRNIKPISKYPTIFAGRNTHVAVVQTKGLKDDEAEANAALIVTAPELLEEVKRFRKTVEYYIGLSGDEDEKRGMRLQLMHLDGLIARAEGA
jgi:hypothetical protein